MPEPDGDPAVAVRGAVHDVVAGFRPTSRPPLQDLVRRRRRRDVVRVVGASLAVLAVVGTSTVLLGPGSSARTDTAVAPSSTATGPADPGPVTSRPAARWVLTLRFAPGTYQDEVSDAAVLACTGLPGVAEDTLVLDSLPPQFVVPITGSDSEREHVLRCLQTVPGGQVSERVAEPSSTPSATRPTRR